MTDIFMWDKDKGLLRAHGVETWKTRRAAGKHVNIAKDEILVPLYNAHNAFVGYGVQDETGVRFKDGSRCEWSRLSDAGKG